MYEAKAADFSKSVDAPPQLLNELHFCANGDPQFHCFGSMQDIAFCNICIPCI